MSKLCYPKEIIGSKFENNTCYYLVQWQNCKNPTWEPDHHISHRTDLISNYRDMLMIEQLGLQSGGYIYCRVSSNEQSKYKEGHTSLHVQEQEIRKYCEENDINVIKVVKEVYSARDMDKMRGLQYLTEIAAPGQKIYVYDISRFSRNAHHALNVLEELKENKVNVVSVTENITYGAAAARNQFRLQLCASTYYSDICSQKVKASIAYRRARGDHIGSTPFGFTTEVDEKTQIRSKVESPDEMQVIEIIRAQWGDTHPADILADLLKKGITFRKRAPTLSGVNRIIGRFDTDLRKSGRVKSFKRKKAHVKTYSRRVKKPYPARRPIHDDADVDMDEGEDDGNEEKSSGSMHGARGGGGKNSYYRMG